MTTLADYNRRLDSLEAELRKLGVRPSRRARRGAVVGYGPWPGRPSAEAGSLERHTVERTRELVEASREFLRDPVGNTEAAVRKKVKELGDAAFDLADRGSLAAAKALETLAFEAWALAAGPLVVAAGLYLLFKWL